MSSLDDLQAMEGSEESESIEADTNAVAAETLPHSNLDRAEAAELLQEVFGNELEAPAEYFDELDVKQFRSDYVALIEPPTPDAPPGLLASTLPLRTESESGVEEPVNLDLAAHGDALQPRNSLVEVAIPSNLSDGISLLDANVGITFASVNAERVASDLGAASAFYPNVRDETDVVITATPTGVETYTHLRTAAAPKQEVFELDIPDGSRLTSSPSGGAEVIGADGEPLLTVQTPWAIDAEGASIPAAIEVEGHSLVVSVDPPAGAAYPILLDPIFESYSFTGAPSKDWYPWSSPGFGYSWSSPKSGMTALSFAGTSTSPGNQAAFSYYVPRYWSDTQAALPMPTSYIRKMSLWNVSYMQPDELGIPYVNRPAYPFMQISLWDLNRNEWVYHQARFGNEGQWTDGSHVFEMTNPNENPDVKQGTVALATLDSWVPAYRYVNVQQASVELTDQDIPGWLSMPSPSGWTSSQRKAIEYGAADYGLGVRLLRVSQPQAQGGTGVVTTAVACSGTASNPCPRTTSNSEQALDYSPTTMAQGENTLAVVAVDPVGNQSAARLVKVKVDHTAPRLSLSGNLTEQATAGTNLREYTLSYNAADGDDAAAVAQSSIGTQGSGPGQLQGPMDVAVDASGNVFVLDGQNNRVVKYDAAGNFLSQFGSTGSGNGQLLNPRRIAITPAGNIWVTDTGNRRLQQFNAKGEFIRKFTYEGGLLGSGKFQEPFAVAAGPNETLWVTDIGSHKVYRFNEDGTYLDTVTNLPLGTTMQTPVGVAVDAFGNAWVTEQESDKVYEFDLSGKYLFSFGGPGSASAQFNNPNGIALADSGNIFVLDQGNNRIQEFKPDGSFLRQFGSLGAANGQFAEGRGIDVAPGNQLIAADLNNHRLVRWTHADQDPQSGASKVEIKVDGTTVHTKAPGCTTKNCSISGSWTLDADDFAGGSHKIEVVATDAVGISRAKTVDVETHGDHTDPTVALSGTMTEQASIGTTRPIYKLKVAATDPGPTAELKSGVASTTIKVDGAVVDSTAPGCLVGGCSVTREWTLDAASYAVGAHNVKVEATDAAGRVGVKTLTVNIARDTTPPEFPYLQSFYTSPSGWVEQKSFELSAAAADEGYGVTSMQLKIDGTVIKSTSQSCASGGCSKWLGLGQYLDMSNYSGGSHPAELIATDGAGNVRKRTWTINVDPEGGISATEATDTLEAVEDTAPEVTDFGPVDALVTEVVGEGGSNPQLVDSGTELVSTGTPVKSSIDHDPEDGFSVETVALNSEEVLRQEEIEVMPVAVGPESGNAKPTDGSAAIIPNTSPNVDTIIRPAYDGLMAFNAIRSPSGQESYSWEVKLGEGETLKLINKQHAGVFWEDGTQAMLLAAQPAHDADGRSVETTLSVTEGNIITLTVHHKVAGVTYPVVAGVGYLGGFQTIEGPQLPPEGYTLPMEHVTEQLYAGPPQVYYAEVSDPGPLELYSNPSCEPGCKYGYKYLQEFGARQCEKGVEPVFSGCSIWEQKLKGFFWFKYHKKVWQSREPACTNHGTPTLVAANNPSVCSWVGPSWQPYGGGAHITAQALYDVTYIKIADTREKHLSVYAYGSGYWSDHDTDCVCNPLP